MATELADLAVARIKRATASLARDYEGREPILKPGDFLMILVIEIIRLVPSSEDGSRPNRASGARPDLFNSYRPICDSGYKPPA
jgi:hypothetical protein